MANTMYDDIFSMEQNAANGRLQVQKNINERLGGMSLVPLTKAEYTTLTPKDSSTIYLVNDNGTYSLYVGDTQISGSGGDGIILVDKALVLEDRTRAARDQLPGEGNAYSVSNHTELYRPTMSRTTRIYDGGYPSRFVPENGYNRYIIIGPNGELPYSRASDGNASLTIVLDRNGVEETLKYSAQTGRSEIVLQQLGFNYYLTTYVSYFIQCTRTRNGSSKTWWYTGEFDGNYRGRYLDIWLSTTDDFYPPSYSYDNTASQLGYVRHNLPALTLGFSIADIHDIENAAPKLILEVGNESIVTYSGTNYISENGSLDRKILTESSNYGCQLGILYDPDTGDLYSDPPKLKTPPTGIYLDATKIAAYTGSEVI